MNKSGALKIGLVIGKFSPLHNGHLDLFKFAIEMVDKLFIVVYNCPNITSIPLNERSGWIRSFLPYENIIVIDGWNAPNEHDDTIIVRNMQEEYLSNVMSGINLTHIISSEDYGEHLSKFLKVENIVYDKKRKNRLISSTMIRKELDSYINQVPKQIQEQVRKDIKSSRKKLMM